MIVAVVSPHRPSRLSSGWSAPTRPQGPRRQPLVAPPPLQIGKSDPSATMSSRRTGRTDRNPQPPPQFLRSTARLAPVSAALSPNRQPRSVARSRVRFDPQARPPQAQLLRPAARRRLTRIGQPSDSRDDIADRLEGRPGAIVRVERDFDVEALFEIERHLDDVERFKASLIERRTEGHGRRRCRPDTLSDHPNDLIFHRRHQRSSPNSACYVSHPRPQDGSHPPHRSLRFDWTANSNITLSAASLGPKAIPIPTPMPILP